MKHLIALLSENYRQNAVNFISKGDSEQFTPFYHFAVIFHNCINKHFADLFPQVDIKHFVLLYEKRNNKTL